MCRCLPWVAHNYQLGELTTVPELRRNVTAMFRKYGDVKSPEVIDLLIYKGREELEVGAGEGRWQGAGLCDWLALEDWVQGHRMCAVKGAMPAWPARQASQLPGPAQLLTRAAPPLPACCLVLPCRALPLPLPCLQMILMQHKQRHHIITQYVHNPARDRVTKPHSMSPFLEQFYKSN